MRTVGVEYSARSGNSETQEAISWPRALEAARLRNLLAKPVLVCLPTLASAPRPPRATQQSCAL